MIIIISTRKISPVCALVIVIVAFVTGCVDSSEHNSVQSGMDITFYDLDGNERQLHEFYGKVIVLDLMAVNCPPCQAQMFELKKIAENYSSDKVTIISIDVWIVQGETVQLIRSLQQAFIAQVGIELTWMFGVDDVDGTILNAYASEGVPTLYILDQNGNIYYSHVGYEQYSSLSTKIDEVLQQ